MASAPADGTDSPLGAFAAWAQSESDGSDTMRADTPAMADDPDMLLAALVERDRALLERERRLEMRERALELAEEELRTGLDAFEEAEAALRDTIALADGAAQADLDRLTRMYETMKPKDASALFETMDPTFAAGFLGQMNPAAAAEILSGLPPEIAYRVSLVLAGRNMRAQAE
ncbi:MAG: hypothetical protein AAGG09_15975 [Pseudomonadota bacterium]